MRKRRDSSAEFKARVVLEVLSGAKTAAEVCRKHQIKQQLFASWKAQSLENAPKPLSRDAVRTKAVPHPRTRTVVRAEDAGARERKKSLGHLAVAPA
jgi:transposase-like protein